MSATGTTASNEFHHGSPEIDPRSLPPKGPKPGDIYVPDLHIGWAIRIFAWDSSCDNIIWIIIIQIILNEDG
jgi:hypothetical protein